MRLVGSSPEGTPALSFVGSPSGGLVGFTSGVAGAVGATGSTGSTGGVGSTGSQGIQGIQGIQGSTGSQGTQGSAGVSLDINGTLANYAAITAVGSPAAGDAYVNAADGKLYFYDGTSWPASGSGVPFVGPQGAQGIQGTQGVQGVTGAVGPVGPIGVDGPIGNTGAASTVAGPKGDTGSVGAVGPVGPVGATGADSTVAGPTGASGPAGTAGAVGATGSASTVAGPAGAVGPSGAPGAAGTAGAPGAAGADSTVPGPTGPTGATGSLSYTPEDSAKKGAANGYAALDANSLVPAAQLPSYVDDVVEYASAGVFPVSGELGKIYIAANTSRSWRWTGTVYAEIIASPGTTDAITEGATNLFFTNTRADARISSSVGVSVQAYASALTTWAGKTAPTGAVVGTTDTQTLTYKDLTSGTNTFPTLNQNTSGTASNVSGTVAVGNGGSGAVTLTGVLKGNGASAFTAATAGTDYVAPGGALGTPSSGTLTNATGLPIAGLTASTSTALGVGTVELGHATDTTLSRSGAGVLAVEGVDVVTLSASQTLTTKTLTNPTVTNYVESVVAIGTVTSASTLSLTSGTVQTATLTASTACTFTMPTATAGKSFVLLLKQAATTGNGTATFTSVKFSGGTAPTITATAGRMDILSFFADGTNWYGSFTQNYTP